MGMPPKIVALARSMHPGPGLAVTLITVLLGVSSGLEPLRVVVLGVAMFFDQASVGLSNDWIDSERDRAVGRTDKPIARGWISREAVRTAAFVCAVAAIGFTVPLGLPATAVHVFVLALAWGYNAGLKNTVLSFLPYAVCFGLLPALATLSRTDPVWPAGWVILAGALLGTGAHFANVVPDLDDDRRTGIRGLPHRIGARASLVITWVSLAAAAAVLAAGTGYTPVAVVGLIVGLVLAIVGVIGSLTRSPGRWVFRLVIVAALVDVAILVLSGGSFVP
jgi:4-hydroxybenzoate polyprenyltransferase